MAQIPYMNWMGNQPSGSAYDVYQYYLGGGSPGGTSTPTSGSAGGITSLPWYLQTGGGGGSGGSVPTNYYQAPQPFMDGRSMALQKSAGMIPDNPLPRNQVKNYLQSLKFPGKQFLSGAGNLLKKGLGSAIGFAGNFLPEMSPEHAINQRWAVDDVGYGTGTQRDQFGMLVGQSLMDPNRTYEDRLSDREEELNEIIASQIKRGTYKKSGWHQRQLDHINKVNEIKEQERIKKEQEDARKKAESKAQWQNRYANWQSPTGRDHAGTGGIGSKESKAGGAPGTKGASSDWRAEGGMIGDLTGDPEYKGWKKMYEANPEIGSMHEKHPTFIKFYQKHERDKKKFGGLVGLLYG